MSPQTFVPRTVNVAISERRGRRRGLRDRRLVDAVDGAMLAAEDPIEVRALERLADRADRLARRSAGVRGLFR